MINGNGIEAYLDLLDEFDDRIDELRTDDDLVIPAELEADLRELEVLLTRLRYRCRDKLLEWQSQPGE